MVIFHLKQYQSNETNCKFNVTPDTDDNTDLSIGTYGTLSGTESSLQTTLQYEVKQANLWRKDLESVTQGWSETIQGKMDHHLETMSRNVQQLHKGQLIMEINMKILIQKREYQLQRHRSLREGKWFYCVYT